ncbi:MAG: YggT family protein [Desulfarculales bacterium]|jgi:YggT family protein|nr:YggT family protein [Desulfarculales bacterium]
MLILYSKLAAFINWILFLYMWIVIIAALLSWVKPDPYNPVVRFFYNLTEPALKKIRRLLPFNIEGIDLSPLFLLLLIVLTKEILLPKILESLLDSAAIR